MADTHLLEPRKRVSQESIVESTRESHRPTYVGFRLLQIAFTAAPIIAGLDKFTNVLTNWDHYLNASVAKVLPVSGHTFMMVAGVVEIVAGFLVALLPRVGGFVVAAWLGGITLNLLLPPGYYDIALRDFGLCLAALALGLLSLEFSPPAKSWVREHTES